jgi:hypothetical protein
MKAFRRFHFGFALLAILLSPGGLTPWLQLSHGCPTAAASERHQPMAGMEGMPGMAMDMAMPAAHHPGPGPGSAPSHGPHPCNCVGACHLLVAVVLPRTALVLVPEVVAAPRALFVPAPAPNLLPLTEFHPPATAPPVIA